MRVAAFMPALLFFILLTGNDYLLKGSYSSIPELQHLEDTEHSDFTKRVHLETGSLEEGPILGGIPEVFNLSTSPFSCTANFGIPTPTIMEGDDCSGALLTTYTILAFGEAFFASGNIEDGDVVQLPIGEHTITFCGEDDCGDEDCLTAMLIVTDDTPPVSSCVTSLTIPIGGGDIANALEGIARVPAEDIDVGSFDNCGFVDLKVRRNYWRNWTCDPSPERWSPWAEQIDFFCCDQLQEITVELRVTDESGNQQTCNTIVTVVDDLAPYCYPPDSEIFSCAVPPDGFPDDLEEAYNTDFTATSILMNELFGPASGTDNCAVDTIVEQTPLLQLNACGVGTITRFFESWQALPDADLSDGIQIDEVLRSTNSCAQVITIQPSADFTITFPADMSGDCSAPELEEPQINSSDCDLFSINSSVTGTYAPSGDECYQVAITYDVINWCHWDGEYEGFELPRQTEEDGDMLATGFSVEAAERPMISITSDYGPDDENCDDVLSEEENEVEDAQDLRYYLTIDRSHPGGEGDSSLPDEFYDNAADSGYDCVPTDANGLQNFGRFRYTQMVRVYNATNLEVVTSDFGGPTAACPNLSAGQFGDDDGSCEEPVAFSFSVSSTCEFTAGTSTSYAYLLSATLDTFAIDTNGDEEIDADEFQAEADVLSLIQENSDGTFTFSGNLPISTLSSDSIVHALLVNFEDDCGNQANDIIEFEVVDCKAPAPICINGLTATLYPGPDGICRDTIHANTFIGFSNSDCTGQGPDLFQGLPIVTRHAIYLAVDVESGPDFTPDPRDSILILDEDSEETTVVYIYGFDEEGNYGYCETYILVQYHVSCEDGDVVPYCLAPDDATFSCSTPPDALPADLEEAYNTDFAATSILINSLFGAPTGSLAVDTLVEFPPMIQLNDCGVGTITRFFEGWQALPDADRSDGLQIDEVNRSTNHCQQVINVRVGADNEIAFPADADIDCSASDLTEVEITTSGCDVFSVTSSIASSYPPTGDECYQLAIVYDVINWCHWDGEYEGYVIPRLTEEDGSNLATGFSVEAAERPILRFTSDTGPDDEDCNDVLSGSENGNDDALDFRYYLTIDRSHPDEAGDSSLPDTQFDNAANTNVDCIPADNSGRRNYGRYQYTQIVSVFNTTELSIETAAFGGPTPSCPNLLIGQFGDEDGDCEEEVEISFEISNYCELLNYNTPPYTTLLSATLDAFALDMNGDGEIDADEFQADEDVSALIQDNGDGTYTLAGSFPVSGLSTDNIVHALQIQIEDACGNETSSFIEFEVIDCKAPAPICINGLNVTLEPQGDGNCAATVHARNFEAAPVYDCNGQGPITQVTSYAIYFADAVDGNPNFLPSQSDSTITITEDSDGPVSVYVYAFDEEGNYDYCETTFIATSSPACFGSVSGIITTRDAEPIAEVEVNINNQYLITTEAEGTYSQGGLERLQSYSIIPFLNSDFSNGVKTIDMIILLKHLLGIDLMENPYQLIAADIDNSGTITEEDLTLLQQLILGSIDVFPANTSWRFIDADYIFPAPTNPWLESFPEMITLGGLLVDVTDADFIGIKIGDLDDSAEANAQQNVDRNLDEAFYLHTDDIELVPGEVYTIPINGQALNRIRGFQGTLQLQGATLLELEVPANNPWQLSVDNFGLRQMSRGYITMACYRAGGSEAGQKQYAIAERKETLFKLIIRADEEVSLHEALQINSRYTVAEAYGAISPSVLADISLGEGEDVMGLGLLFTERLMTEQGFELYQNRPNPFQTETMINFKLPNRDELQSALQVETVTLTITDITGRVIYQVKADYVVGYNRLKVTKDMIQNATGVLSYTISTSEFTATKKMIVLE